MYIWSILAHWFWRRRFLNDPTPFLHFLKLSPLWRGSGHLFEQFRIPFIQGWFVLSLIEIGLLVLEDWLIDWLSDYLQFYVPLKSFSLIWRRHHCRWRAAKFRPMLGTQGLWAGRDLYRATPAVTRDLSFSGLIRRTAPFRHLLRHTRGCGGSILTRILTGLFLSSRGILEKKIFFNINIGKYGFPYCGPPDPRGPWREQFWIYIISESFHVNLIYSGSVVLEKRFLNDPTPFLQYLWLSPLWRGPDPLFE
jgi:hypothetical protein